MSALIDLACELISQPSVTPDDHGCQPLIGARLEALGFALESMPSGNVRNLWARLGKAPPLVCLAGHTDVVPPGPASLWRSPPFEPQVSAGWLTGRGAADMKGSLAAMVCAVENYVASGRKSRGSLAFLLTSDEEGPATDGTRAVMERLGQRGEFIDYCVIGEPASMARTGDRVRVGRRGSLNAVLEVHGVQGHVAYPEEVRNPVHLAMPALAAILAETWDQGTAQFPPTSLQFTDLRAGVGASNVTPAGLTACFNLRFSPAITGRDIERRLRALLDEQDVDYSLVCTVSGEPFFTPEGRLVDASRRAIYAVTGLEPELSTGGGTSDGRFIAPAGTEVVEIGPPGRTLHQVNECVRVDDLETLTKVYEALLCDLLQ